MCHINTCHFIYLMDLIQQFIDTYKMKWTFYDAAGRLAAEKLQLARYPGDRDLSRQESRQTPHKSAAAQFQT